MQNILRQLCNFKLFLNVPKICSRPKTVSTYHVKISRFHREFWIWWSLIFFLTNESKSSHTWVNTNFFNFTQSILFFGQSRNVFGLQSIWKVVIIFYMISFESIHACSMRRYFILNDSSMNQHANSCRQDELN